MSSIGKAIGKVVGKITGASDAADAARDAGYAQASASQQGIDEQRRQFDKIIELMKPYVEVGEDAVRQMGDLVGFGDEENRKKTIDAILQGSEYGTLLQQAEEGMLQNASATGGLRGGNLQEQLMRYRPELLTGLINQQYNRLGGLSQLGQASAGMQASAGQAAATNISNLHAQKGAAIAGGIIGKGNEQRMVFGDLMNIANTASKFLPW